MKTTNRTARDVAFWATTLLAFPVVLNLTSLAATGEGRDLDDPLFHRGGQSVETAGR